MGWGGSPERVGWRSWGSPSTGAGAATCCFQRVVLSQPAWHEWLKNGVTALTLAALFLLFRFTARSEREGPLTARS